MPITVYTLISKSRGPRREWHDTFKVLKGKNLQPRIPDSQQGYYPEWRDKRISQSRWSLCLQLKRLHTPQTSNRQVRTSSSGYIICVKGGAISIWGGNVPSLARPSIMSLRPCPWSQSTPFPTHSESLQGKNCQAHIS